MIKRNQNKQIELQASTLSFIYTIAKLPNSENSRVSKRKHRPKWQTLRLNMSKKQKKAHRVNELIRLVPKRAQSGPFVCPRQSQRRPTVRVEGLKRNALSLVQQTCLVGCSRAWFP